MSNLAKDLGKLLDSGYSTKDVISAIEAATKEFSEVEIGDVATDYNDEEFVVLDKGLTTDDEKFEKYGCDWCRVEYTEELLKDGTSQEDIDCVEWIFVKDEDNVGYYAFVYEDGGALVWKDYKNLV